MNDNPTHSGPADQAHDTTREPMRFYLTQRLTRRDRPGAQGFDALFECQYMGSSEFEWGAVPQSLKRLRGTESIGHHVGVVTRNGVERTVHVIGDAAVIVHVPDDLTAWLAQPHPRCQDLTWFPEQIEGSAQEWQQDTNAWWSLSDDVMWTLDADIAQALVAGVTGTTQSTHA